MWGWLLVTGTHTIPQACRTCPSAGPSSAPVCIAQAAVQMSLVELACSSPWARTSPASSSERVRKEPLSCLLHPCLTVALMPSYSHGQNPGRDAPKPSECPVRRPQKGLRPLPRSAETKRQPSRVQNAPAGQAAGEHPGRKGHGQTQSGPPGAQANRRTVGNEWLN